MSELPANLTPVREAHVFDEALLADYMKNNVDGFRGPLSVLHARVVSSHLARRASDHLPLVIDFHLRGE